MKASSDERVWVIEHGVIAILLVAWFILAITMGHHMRWLQAVLLLVTVMVDSIFRVRDTFRAERQGIPKMRSAAALREAIFNLLFATIVAGNLLSFRGYWLLVDFLAGLIVAMPNLWLAYRRRAG